MRTKPLDITDPRRFEQMRAICDLPLEEEPMVRDTHDYKGTKPSLWDHLLTVLVFSAIVAALVMITLGALGG